MSVVTIERSGAVATATIDNPPVNALNRAVVEGLDTALTELIDDPGVRILVIRGAGEKAFVAGADIKEFPTTDTGGGKAIPLAGTLERLEACRLLTIAELHGFCLGGGLELAMACDFRVAAEDAQLGQPEVKLGLIPGAGGTQRLPRLIGRSRALLLNTVGDPISGAQAYKWGLVEKVVPRGELEGAVVELAQRLAGQSPAAIATLKRLHVETRGLPLSAGLEAESRGFAECLRSEDGQEGVAAFLEKRSPVWPSA